MSITMDEEIKHWTAKRKTALVMDIIQGKTTVSEAARGFDLAPSEIEGWVNDAKQGMENALRAKPLERCAWLLACSVSRKDASPQSSASARRIPVRILSGNGVHRFRNHCSTSPEYAAGKAQTPGHGAGAGIGLIQPYPLRSLAFETLFLHQPSNTATTDGLAFTDSELPAGVG
ncbi:transposase [Aeromonas veronii]|uniref:transposase n=1 Tax=Aeromonas veronii TaxID=654 RepID=UPI003D204646